MASTSPTCSASCRSCSAPATTTRAAASPAPVTLAQPAPAHLPQRHHHHNNRCALDRARSQLAATDASLDDLTPARLRALCSRAAGRFTSALELAIGGSARPEARGLGQTLADEYRDGAGPLLPKSAQATHVEVDGAGAKLFGGAQYHRLLRELHVATRALPPVAVSDEDVANALGVGAQHDSLHVGRAVCQIALHRSAKQLHDVLRALFERLRYIMGRMLLFVQAVCAADALGDRDPLARLGGPRPDAAEFADKFAEGGDADEDGTAALEKLLEPMLWRALADAYADQLGECLDSCADVCMRDLRAIAATDGEGAPLPRTPLRRGSRTLPTWQAVRCPTSPRCTRYSRASAR